MELSEMSKDERSLLLYFETREVDQRCAVHTQHMNADDMAIAKHWNEIGFVKFGRIASDCLPMPSGSTHWCKLSEDAWRLAHQERKDCAERSFHSRIWYSTDEKRLKVVE